MCDLIILLIRGYQRFISPFLPSSCRFYPSCSQYALESYHRFGIFRGTQLCVLRLVKCQPLHPGGFDPVPEEPLHSRCP
ncbi:MAG: membrane protein insertion efficiency factor YidD [SAR324 cluster bacterium]|nr:membrane protein insertion efficiency factor YidD [SAR324 cluster bacterium]